MKILVNNPDIMIIQKVDEPTLIIPTETKDDDRHGVDFAPLFEAGAELGGFEAWG